MDIIHSTTQRPLVRRVQLSRLRAPNEVGRLYYFSTSRAAGSTRLLGSLHHSRLRTHHLARYPAALPSVVSHGVLPHTARRVIGWPSSARHR